MTTNNSTTSSSLTPGALVRIQHNTGLFKITCPTAWADADHSMATHYNVTSSKGRLHLMVPVDRMAVCSTAPSMAQSSGQVVDKMCAHSPLSRMLRHPELTLSWGTRLLGRDTAKALSLETLAKRLLPHYKLTHCWACKSTLDSLRNETCEKCGGIQCECGGCRCNWPYPPQTAYSRNGITNPAHLIGLHLPR